MRRGAITLEATSRSAVKGFSVRYVAHAPRQQGLEGPRQPGRKNSAEVITHRDLASTCPDVHALGATFDNPDGPKAASPTHGDYSLVIQLLRSRSIRLPLLAAERYMFDDAIPTCMLFDTARHAQATAIPSES